MSAQHFATIPLLLQSSFNGETTTQNLPGWGSREPALVADGYIRLAQLKATSECEVLRYIIERRIW